MNKTLNIQTYDPLVKYIADLRGMRLENPMVSIELLSSNFSLCVFPVIGVSKNREEGGIARTGHKQEGLRHKMRLRWHGWKGGNLR